MSRRRVELVVLAFGAAFAASVALSLRAGYRPHRADPKKLDLPSASAGGQATAVLSGFDYTETVKGKPVFRIRSERTVGFGPGPGLAPDRYALEKVALTLFSEEHAPVEVHADSADYDSRTKAAVLRGNVRWTDDKGALGETETVVYQPEKRLLEAPKAVHLSQGSFEAQATSGRYDVAKRETRLDGPISGSGSGAETGGLTHLAAQSAVSRRDEQVIELEGSVAADTKKGDRLACDRLQLKTGPDGKKLEWARAFGNVRGRIAPSSLPAAGETGAAGVARDYASEQAVVFFGPDGEARSLALVGRPASVSEGPRRVEADAIDLEIAGGKPASARAQGSVRLASPPNRAESQSAIVQYGADGAISSLELDGSVRLAGDGRAGTAEKAIEVPERGVWVLTGSPSASASVESGGSKVSAPRIEVGEKRRDVTADGGARAVFTPEKGRAAPASPLGDPQKPTYGKAARIYLDDAAHVATLSGGASLWQETSSLSADDITLNDAERTLLAVGNVRTVIPPSEPSPSKSSTPTPTPSASAKKPAPAAAKKTPPLEATVVTARRLNYKDATRSALFEDGVAMNRGPWKARSNNATAFLDKDNKIDRVELVGGVSMSDAETGRSGEAERAVDEAGQGRTILEGKEGKPARVTDADGSQVVGATLTITDRGRRVEVTAPEGGKTVTVHKTKRD